MQKVRVVGGAHKRVEASQIIRSSPLAELSSAGILESMFFWSSGRYATSAVTSEQTPCMFRSTKYHVEPERRYTKSASQILRMQSDQIFKSCTLHLCIVSASPRSLSCIFFVFR